jgi:hypothetical protein
MMYSRNNLATLPQIIDYSYWDSDLYTKLIKPLSHKAKEKNEEFELSYSNVINKFTRDFSQDFCLKDGTINWVKLVRFNSQK